MSSPSGRNGGAVADAPAISRSKSGSVAAAGRRRSVAAQDGNSRAEMTSELEATVAAIGRSQAVIEFQMDGTIVKANENFLHVMGYSLEEVKGRHHRMFVDSADANSPAYAEFWASLGPRPSSNPAECRHIGKGGKEVYIQASYNPMLPTLNLRVL